jgi:hypothetical protein
MLRWSLSAGLWFNACNLCWSGETLCVYIISYMLNRLYMLDECHLQFIDRRLRTWKLILKYFFIGIYIFGSTCDFFSLLFGCRACMIVYLSVKIEPVSTVGGEHLHDSRNPTIRCRGSESSELGKLPPFWRAKPKWQTKYNSCVSVFRKKVTTTNFIPLKIDLTLSWTTVL